MLVVTRKVGQAIRIGNDIEVVIKSISSGRISVAIDAPKRVKVLRGELVSQETPQSAAK